MNNELEKSQDGKMYSTRYELGKWGPTARLLTGVVSLLTFNYSKKIKGVPKDLLRFFAVSLGARALLNKDLTQVIGAILSPTIRVRRQIVVNAPADEVARFWSKLENYPKFMSYVRKVDLSKNGNLQWEISGPGGILLRWESSIESWWPRRKLSWLSTSQSAIFNSGTILISSIEYDRSTVWVELAYGLKGGGLGFAFAHVVGFDPRERIDHDLSIMKELIEEDWKKKCVECVLPLTG